MFVENKTLIFKENTRNFFGKIKKQKKELIKKGERALTYVKYFRLENSNFFFLFFFLKRFYLNIYSLQTS